MASTKNSLNGKNSMLSGARVVISPNENLNFEILQIANGVIKMISYTRSNIDALFFEYK